MMIKVGTSAAICALLGLAGAFAFHATAQAAFVAPSIRAQHDGIILVRDLTPEQAAECQRRAAQIEAERAACNDDQCRAQLQAEI